MPYSHILATGSYLPQKILTNRELEKIVDTSDEWIVERTGIRQRYIASDDETASMMAYHATQQALTMAALPASAIDMIIVATTTPDQVMPSTACLLQKKLQIPKIPAFDIVAACSGFLYAMSVADQFIRAGVHRTILVVGSEVMSSIVDWKDRRTCVLFGDGAGAVLLQASDHPGVLSTHLHAEGSYSDALYVPSALKSQQEDVFVTMQGQEVFRFAVTHLGEVVHEALAANHLTTDDIDWLVPHQANIRIIQSTAKKLSLSMDKVILTVAEQGNTSAASVPLALDSGIRSGKIQRGQTLLLEAIGGGFAWGAALLIF
jgi:3-oxoacyl-[acyl-carrier-protein] synthase III